MKKEEKLILLNGFNKRYQNSFGSVYTYFYNDFFRYALYISHGTDFQSEDIIHDIFLDIWLKEELKFDSLLKIKAFVIGSIHNKFANHIRRSKNVERYASYLTTEIDFDVLEVEIFSIFNETEKLLPKDSAEIIRLFFEGYKPSDIAEILNKSTQTVYNIKSEALRIIRKALKDKDRDKLYYIIISFSLTGYIG